MYMDLETTFFAKELENKELLITCHCMCIM